MRRNLRDTFMMAAARVLAGLALLLAPGVPAAQPLVPAFGDSQVAGAAADALLDNTFRIDIETITATLDWYPASGVVDGTAQLDFRLRPGQSRAVFNFTPFVTARTAISRLVLDGRSLGPQSDADVGSSPCPARSSRSSNCQLPLDPALPHTLTIDYRLTLPTVYPRFSSEVNDIRGQGNEAVWPTLNTPHELARHLLTFRVHDAQAFRFVGSGAVGFTATGDVQQWVLDTQRAVSSYSVMFVLLPAADTEYREWLIDGVTVRAVAYPAVNLTEAQTRLTSWLPELRRRFGPFPALARSQPVPLQRRRRRHGVLRRDHHVAQRAAPRGACTATSAAASWRARIPIPGTTRP